MCDVPSLRETLIVRRSFDEVLSWLREDKKKEIPAVVPRTDVAGQTLWPWTDQEELKFCGPATEKMSDGERPVEAKRRSRKPQLPPRHEIDPQPTEGSLFPPPESDPPST